MPLPRFAKLSPEDQQRIVDVATSEFVEHGFENASLNRIVERAKISKGAMYYYFADKADLYRTVVTRALEAIVGVAGDLDPFADAEGFWTATAEFLERVTLATLQRPELGALAREVYERQPGVLDELVARTRTKLEAVLVQGQRVGAVRADVRLDLLTTATLGLLMALDRWFAEHFTELPPDELLTLSLQSFRLGRDLLEPRAT